MKHKFIAALLVLTLGASAMLYAQADNPEQGKREYPKITADDLAACKNEIAELHRQEIIYYENEARKYCTNPHPNDHPDNCKNANEYVSESSSTSNMAWFMEGKTHCEDGLMCYGLDSYNNDPNEEFLRDAMHYDFKFDAEEAGAEYRKNNAEFNAKYKVSPQEALHYENQYIQEQKFFGLAQVTDKCISKIWFAKLDGKEPANSKIKQAAGNSAPAISAIGAQLSQEQISACSKDIKSKQVESQSWGGDVNAVANRLGEYQKELFEGRCAGHPEAQAYIAGANKMLGYQQEGPAAIPASPGQPTGAQSNNSASADSRTSPKREKRRHVPDAVATKCLSLNEKPGFGGFVNSCSYAVEYSFCAYRPKKGAWSEAFDCEKNQGGSDIVGPNKTQGSHTKNAEKIHWVACRYRGPDGKPIGVSPMDIKWDGQKRELTFRCGEWGSGGSGK